MFESQSLHIDCEDVAFAEQTGHQKYPNEPNCFNATSRWKYRSIQIFEIKPAASSRHFQIILKPKAFGIHDGNGDDGDDSQWQKDEKQNDTGFVPFIGSFELTHR